MQVGANSRWVFPRYYYPEALPTQFWQPIGQQEPKRLLLVQGQSVNRDPEIHLRGVSQRKYDDARRHVEADIGSPRVRCSSALGRALDSILGERECHWSAHRPSLSTYLPEVSSDQSQQAEWDECHAHRDRAMKRISICIWSKQVSGRAADPEPAENNARGPDIQNVKTKLGYGSQPVVAVTCQSGRRLDQVGGEQPVYLHQRRCRRIRHQRIVIVAPTRLTGR
jgi:hypothetical protein